MNFENRLLTGKDQYLIIKNWYQKWGDYPCLPYELYPKLTALTYLNGRLVSTAGCYLSDRYIAFIDNVICDPEVDKETKDLAVDSSVAFVMKLAKEQGFKYWNAHSKLDVIEKRSRKFNRTYCEPGHYFMTGEL